MLLPRSRTWFPRWCASSAIRAAAEQGLNLGGAREISILDLAHEIIRTLDTGARSNSSPTSGRTPPASRTCGAACPQTPRRTSSSATNRSRRWARPSCGSPPTSSPASGSRRMPCRSPARARSGCAMTRRARIPRETTSALRRALAGRVRDGRCRRTLTALAPADPAEAAARTIVSLTFDDADANQLQALPALKANGMKARSTCPRVHRRRGTHDACRPDDPKNAGHEIGGHNREPPDLAQVSVDEAKRQICTDRRNLTSWGFTVRSYLRIPSPPARPRSSAPPKRADTAAPGCSATFAVARLVRTLLAESPRPPTDSR